MVALCFVASDVGCTFAFSLMSIENGRQAFIGMEVIAAGGTSYECIKCAILTILSGVLFTRVSKETVPGQVLSR